MPFPQLKGGTRGLGGAPYNLSSKSLHFPSGWSYLPSKFTSSHSCPCYPSHFKEHEKMVIPLLFITFVLSSVALFFKKTANVTEPIIKNLSSNGSSITYQIVRNAHFFFRVSRVGCTDHPAPKNQLLNCS